MKRKRNEKVIKWYISCHYYHNAMCFVRKKIKKFNVSGISLAPSIVSNNINTIFDHLKDERGLNCIKNSKFKINCTYFAYIFTELHDIERTISFELRNSNSVVYQHCNKYNRTFYECDVNRSDIVRYTNFKDLIIAKRSSKRGRNLLILSV